MGLKNYVHALMTDRRNNIFDSLVKVVLFALSFVYEIVVIVTRSLYTIGILPSYRSPKPVISVGNITAGGSGKTPLVIAIVKILKSRNVRVAILTRGYMPRNANVFSDEARMMEEHLPGVPVMTGRDRQASIKECLKHHAVDVFVCDDAFQHWPLKRDLDIVAVDTVNPVGNGHLLPRGILREPSAALSRAHVLVMTKSDQPQAKPERLQPFLEHLNRKALIVQSQHVCAGFVDVYNKNEQDSSHFVGITVVAFCAIADSNSFRQSLQKAGLNVANIFVFMDHHVFTEEDMAMVRRYATEHDIKTIVTTHKDAVKLEGFRDFWSGFKVYYSQLELEFTQGKNAFIERIISIVYR
jgi:tetraacyldisaccharide 4'-kinase